jgi:hypothetical protein
VAYSQSAELRRIFKKASGFLEALAETVTPTRDEQLATDYYEALRSALGRPATIGVSIDKTKKTVTVLQPPAGVSTFRVGDLRPHGKREQGAFTTNTITLTKVDPTKPLIVELYDRSKTVVARAIVN